MRLGSSYINFGGPVFLLDDHLKEQKWCLSNSSFSTPGTPSHSVAQQMTQVRIWEWGRWGRHNKTELGSVEWWGLLMRVFGRDRFACGKLEAIRNAVQAFEACTRSIQPSSPSSSWTALRSHWKTLYSDFNVRSDPDKHHGHITFISENSAPGRRVIEWVNKTVTRTVAAGSCMHKLESQSLAYSPT